MPFHARSLSQREWRHGRRAKALGRFLQIFDGKAALQSRRLYDGVVLAAESKDCMPGIDGRSSLHVVGMQRGESNLTAALEPAHRIDVMAFAPGNPRIVVSVPNPAAGVTHGPVVAPAGGGPGRIDYGLIATDGPIAHRSRHAGEFIVVVDVAVRNWRGLRRPAG